MVYNNNCVTPRVDSVELQQVYWENRFFIDTTAKF